MFRTVFDLLFVFYFASSCAFGANKINKRGNNHWSNAKLFHTGRDLSDSELIALATTKSDDEIHFNDVLRPFNTTRVVGTKEHALVRQHIIKEMEDLLWTVEEHTFRAKTPIGSKPFTNIIATLNPSATRRLVLACHYDSKLTPEGFIGATDSAVPCAMMIHLAYALREPLAAQKRHHDLTLQFIFFDGEEAFVRWNNHDSLYGSRHLANKMAETPFPPGGQFKTTELDRIDLFVLLDLLGSEECSFLNLYQPSENWYKGLALFERRLSSLGVKDWHRRPNLFQERNFFRAGIEDDHKPFLEKGVPILHLISTPFPSVWHTLADNFDAIHYPTVRNLNFLIRAFVVNYLHLKL